MTDENKIKVMQMAVDISMKYANRSVSKEAIEVYKRLKDAIENNKTGE